jgi:hypothetical protein
VQDGVGLRTKARVSSNVDEAITPIAAKRNNVSEVIFRCGLLFGWRKIIDLAYGGDLWH